MTNWSARWASAEDLVVGVWAVLLVALGIVAARELLFRTLGSGIAETSAYAAWLVEYVLLWGVLAIGGTYGYLRIRDLDAKFVVETPSDGELRLIAGLVALVSAVLVIGAVVGRALPGVPVYALSLLSTIPGPEPISAWAGWGTWLGGTTFRATLALLFVGPGTAAIVHGILQNTLRETFSGNVSTVMTAILFGTYHVAVVSLYRSGSGSGELAASVSIFALFVVFVAGVSTVYERSRSLLLPMIAYGLLAASGYLFWMVLRTIEISAVTGGAYP